MRTLLYLLNLLLRRNFFVNGFPYDNKQLLDEGFVITGITKVEVSVIRQAKAEPDDTYRDLGFI